MAAPIRAVITFALSNYSLTFLTMGLLFAVVAIVRAPRSIGPSGTVERLIAWHVFWSIGVGYFYNFVVHGFFGKISRSEPLSAISIKWQPSIISRRATPASSSIWMLSFRYSEHCCYGSSIATAIPMPRRRRRSPRPDARGGLQCLRAAVSDVRRRHESASNNVRHRLPTSALARPPR